MGYLRGQRQKLLEELEKYKKGKKLLEEQNLKILEEQNSRKKIRDNKHQTYHVLNYKDTQLKTFYMEYVQQRYKVANEPFPQRNLYTINIKDEQANIDINNNEMCPGCGRMFACQMQNANYNLIKFDNGLCPGCGRMIAQHI